MKPQITALAAWLIFSGILPGKSQAPAFNFQSVLFGPAPSLDLYLESVDAANGTVTINGGDWRQPLNPFSWDWGDGSTNSEFFAQTHSYVNHATNYVVTVTAWYDDGTSGTAQIAVWFVPPAIQPVTLPPDVPVTVPISPQTLESRQPGYGFPEPLTNFNSANFGLIPRATVEYVLTAGAAMQSDFANGDFFRTNGLFPEVVLCDTTGGFYSLWYATPAALAAGNADAFASGVPWTSALHEMGHNFTLNSPAGFYFGGKIDGSANAIISESLAQIFQHATAYELINHSAELGLGSDVVAAIRHDALGSMSWVRSSYDEYVAQGNSFHSWNDPATPDDETFDTFMTVAYKFFAHAETDGRGYRVPLKRLMQALQLFNSDWLESYDPDENTPAAESFRATLWVAALSHAYQSDLRAEFTVLGFPIDDGIYEELSAQMSALPDIAHAPHQLRILRSGAPALSVTGPVPRFYRVERATRLSAPDWTHVADAFVTSTNSFWTDTSATHQAGFYRTVMLQ